jgi:hypothetical protein
MPVATPTHDGSIMKLFYGWVIGPWAGGWVYDTFGSYFWLYIGSFGIGPGAVAIAMTFSPPRGEVGLLRPVAA